VQRTGTYFWDVPYRVRHFGYGALHAHAHPKDFATVTNTELKMLHGRYNKSKSQAETRGSYVSSLKRIKIIGIYNICFATSSFNETMAHLLGESGKDVQSNCYVTTVIKNALIGSSTKMEDKKPPAPTLRQTSISDFGAVFSKQRADELLAKFVYTSGISFIELQNK
jgi:hypothetical protein